MMEFEKFGQRQPLNPAARALSAGGHRYKRAGAVICAQALPRTAVNRLGQLLPLLTWKLEDRCPLCRATSSSSKRH